MKLSHTYTFYPVNKALERAIAHSIGLLDEAQAEAAAPDTSVTVADNFRHSRGNFEQQRFNSGILENAGAVLQEVLTDDYRNQNPLAWAECQNHLGNITAARAQKLRDTQLYQSAKLCFEKALEVIVQDEAPLEWAATQFNIGTVNQALGRQLGDTSLLKASIDAYTNALLEWPRKVKPIEWSCVMHQLGAAFHTFGMLLKGNRTLQKSVVAYKNALEVLDADNFAFELAAAHNNCGAVLLNMAETEGSVDRLEESIRSYETALTVCMEQQLPIHLAVLCRVNRSTARGVLAELRKDTTLADEVADEFELIVECFPHALQPLCLKHCEQQLSMTRSLSSSEMGAH